MTGYSFYAESLFPIQAVEFNAGELRKYEHLSDESGKKVYVESCAGASCSPSWRACWPRAG
jgi:hypothetical protein